MPITQIKKRTGAIVDFDITRIERAIEKACIAIETSVATDQISAIAQDVVSVIESKFGVSTPGVEDIQDVVERSLALHGFFDVAKSYILYRQARQIARDAERIELLRKIERSDLRVKKRDGSIAMFDIGQIREAIAIAVTGFESVINIEKIVEETKSSLFDGISTGEINKAIELTLRAHIEEDPAYAKVTARFLWNDLYKAVIGINERHPDFEKEYRTSFVRNVQRGVEEGKLDPRLLTFDLPRLAQDLRIERDGLFDYLGAQVLHGRYFIQTLQKEYLELPQHFWMRIAMGMALLEQDKDAYATQFYHVMSAMYYTPSTPTLLHAGTPKPQLSSCFLNTVPDTLEGIFKTYADNAQLSKWSGGIGTDWTPVRATGAMVKAIGVESQGVIPYLKIANDVTVAINRSGKRRGATNVYLETWHLDIEDFLELRKNTGDERRRAHDINTVNWIPDLFMKRVRENGTWTLFSPQETPELHDLYGKAFDEKYIEYETCADRGELQQYKRIEARDLWKRMLTMLFETGHPWMTFKDPCNLRSPQDHAGVVHNSNLCTEITLNTSPEETAVCNLGSLNFAKFVVGGRFDRELVGKVTTVAMRMLDNVIDINFYPTKDAERSNMRHRPVGLGIRGYQDALYMLGIHFDTDEAVRFADESMEVVAYYAILASTDLAHERGAYQSYKGSKWDRGILPQDTIAILEQERGMSTSVAVTAKLDWSPVRAAIAEYGMRNSNTMAIAPTATTALIVGCIPTVEPIYKNLFVKSNQAGEFVVINPYLIAELKELGLWTPHMLGLIKYHDGSIAQIEEIPPHIRRKYKEVFEIDPRWILKAAAFRGKWIDQSQSINIFFRGLSGKELSDVYFYAWELGLKTTYYLRTLSASQVEKSTVNTVEYGVTHKRSEHVTEATAVIATVTEALPEIITMEVPAQMEIPNAAEYVVAQSTPPVASAISAAVSTATFDRKPGVFYAETEECESCQA